MAPTPEGSRAYIITATSRGGLVVIASTTLMSWMVLCFMFRAYTRIDINGPFGMDDLAAGIGTIFGVIHVGVLVKAVSDGLGKSKSLLDASHLVAAEKGLYVSDIFFLLGHCAAKISVTLLIRRLGRERFYRRICLGVVGAITIWGVASILTVCFKCNLSEPWLITESCTNVKLRWQIVTAFDVISEASILGLVVYLVWDLRMAWIRKVVVFAAFGCRIPIILVSIIRVTDIDGAVSPIDPTLRSVDSSISTEVLLHYSLMAATIPCLKPFVIAFNTGWGQGQGKGSSYVLRDSSAGTGKRFSRSVQRESVPPTPFRVNPYAHAAGATHATGDDEIEARPNTVESEESRRMVIRETRSWIVEHESYEMAQYASAGTHGHFGRVCSVTS